MLPGSLNGRTLGALLLGLSSWLLFSAHAHMAYILLYKTKSSIYDEKTGKPY